MEYELIGGFVGDIGEHSIVVLPKSEDKLGVEVFVKEPSNFKLGEKVKLYAFLYESKISKRTSVFGFDDLNQMADFKLGLRIEGDNFIAKKYNLNPENYRITPLCFVKK